MPKIFFSSDHHFSHNNIIKYCDRPFRDVDEMNKKMVEWWNELVSPEDEVYYLGDFSLSTKVMEEFAPQLNGKKYLILGNHDACHSSNTVRLNILERYRDAGWLIISERLERLFTHEFILCHMPYSPSEDGRFVAHHPHDEGNFLLHGHVHKKWKIKDKQINVGVDVWNYRPVELSQILEIVDLINASKKEQ